MSQEHRMHISGDTPYSCECHITIPNIDASNVLAKAVGDSLGFKFSKIDGDPMLGEKVFSYLTCHSRELRSMQKKMQQASAVLRAAGIEVLREKIEIIVHDTKTNLQLVLE